MRNKMKRQNGGGQSSGRVEIDFVLEHRGEEEVCICGDFNDWQLGSLRMIRSHEGGHWEKRLVLPPGRYEYKFVEDGRWIHDARARLNVPNAFGSFNSVLEVKP